VDNQNQSIFIYTTVDIGEWKKDEKRFGIFEDVVGYNKQVYHDIMMNSKQSQQHVKHHPMKTVTSIMTPK